MENRYTAVKSCHSVGKTAIAARLGCWWLSCHAPGEAFLVTSAPTGQQVKALLWREINQVHATGGLPGRTNVTEWWFDNELVGFGRSVRDVDPTAFQGIHAPYVLVVLDEACGITHGIWTAAETLVANVASRFLAIGNPDDPATMFGDMCKPGSGYNVIGISAFDSPAFTDEECPGWLLDQLVSKEWVEERKSRWGEESPLYLSKVLGEFPEQSEDGLIPISSINAAIERELEVDDELPLELGVDVARFGLDRSVIYKRQGPVAEKFSSLSKRDTVTVAKEVRRAIRETGAEIVKIDDIGLGGGVTDRLNEMYMDGEIEAKIVGVNVAESPLTKAADETYRNKRAELNWIMRERFMEGRIDIDDNEDLHAQAGSIKYDTKGGRIQIMPKEEMKKKHLPSPDDWDALVLAFTPEQYGKAMAFDEQLQNFQFEPFAIPKFWPRVFGLDIKGGIFSAVWGAWDIETNVCYLYDEYTSNKPDLSINASAIRKRKDWIPGLFSPRDHKRSKDEGQRLSFALQEEHLNIFELEVEPEAMVHDMTAALVNQSLRVSKYMSLWTREYLDYRRDRRGELVQERDGLLRASGLIVAGGQHLATTLEHVQAEPEDFTDEERDTSTGY